MNGYHYTRVIQTFRAALGVDVRAMLAAPEVNAFMSERLAANVDLIKTIPPRMHESLTARMQREFAEAPFDKQRLRKLLKDEYKSSGYNLRRIVRDQTSKAIGGLSEIRQRQVGVDQYQWITAQDSRVRPTHVANSGRIFAWASPPPETGHPGNDISCRCVPVPLVSRVQRDRLKSSGPLSIVGNAA